MLPSLKFWISALLITVSFTLNVTSKTLLNFHHTHTNNSITQALKDPVTTTTPNPILTPNPEHVRDIIIGPCVWAVGRTCPDKDIKFVLYTRKNIHYPQTVQIGGTAEKSNLTSSYFDPRHPTKIIIHGYNSDMWLRALDLVGTEYLMKSEYNVIYVDWSVLALGPCYINAVHNTKHVGACIAQLVERILETGTSDMHVIGFSLGAHVTNYIARSLGSFMLPRITGLDPAMPLFITAGKDDKLDASDAAYVDVYHTNALVQGKLERCGHADFYMNGGIMQPGCTKAGTNPFACSHQRAPEYFFESIRSPKGFWGWSCSSYLSYLLGMCPPTNYLLEAGDNIRSSTKGMFLVETNDTAPYALGKWTDLPTLGIKRVPSITVPMPPQKVDPLLKHIDNWGKLDTPFNNIPEEDYAQRDDPYANNNWTYYSELHQKDSNSNSVEELDFEELPTHSPPITAKNPPPVQHNKFVVPFVDWNQYKENLTNGVIDQTLFQLPHIQND